MHDKKSLPCQYSFCQHLITNQNPHPRDKGGDLVVESMVVRGQSMKPEFQYIATSDSIASIDSKLQKFIKLFMS